MISVIIPALNSPVIDRVIRALQAQTACNQLGEIIVVGQDGRGLLPPTVRFIPTATPVSAAAARNIGVAHSAGELLWFVDADCVAAPDALAQLLAHATAAQPVVGGAVTFPHTDFWTISDNLTAFLGFLPWTPAGERPYLLTGNLLIARSLLAAAGGFDEAFAGAAGEDMEFGLRLRAAGHRLLFVPAAIVLHDHIRSSGRVAWRHLAQYGRAHSLFRQRHKGLDSAAPWLRWLLGHPRLLGLAAPLIGAVRLAGLIWQRPFLWRYWYVWPGLYIQQVAWTWGLAAGLRTP